MSNPLKKVGKIVKKAFTKPFEVMVTDPIKSVGKDVAGALTPSMDMPAPDNTAAEILARQQQQAENANADLTLENIANIQPGGTAGSLGTGSTRRRRRNGQSVSTSLGINV
jgi:hypothetical protein